MASPASSPAHQTLPSDGLDIPGTLPDELGAAQTLLSEPDLGQNDGADGLARTHKRERPAEEDWASKLSGDAGEAAVLVTTKVDVVVENLAGTAEKALEEVVQRLDEAEAVTQQVLSSATGGGAVVPEVAEQLKTAVETAKLSVETADVIVEGVGTISKETHEEKPIEESAADQLLNSNGQNATDVANAIARDEEPPKKKPKQEEEEGTESS